MRICDRVPRSARLTPATKRRAPAIEIEINRLDNCPDDIPIGPGLSSMVGVCRAPRRPSTGREGAIVAPPSATALADVSYVSTVLMALVGGYLTMRPGLAAWIEKNPIVHYGLVVFFLSAVAVSVGAAWWSNLKIDQEHSSETADLNSRISALEAGQKRDQTQHANIIAAVRHT